MQMLILLLMQAPAPSEHGFLLSTNTYICITKAKSQY